MRLTRLAVPMLALSLALGGCDTIKAVVAGGSVAGSAPVTMLTAEKSLTIAHLAYNGIGTSLKNAADTGVLKGANAATAKVWYDKAGDALLVADKSDDAANANGIMAAVTLAEEAIGQASAIANPKK